MVSASTLAFFLLDPFSCCWPGVSMPHWVHIVIKFLTDVIFTVIIVSVWFRHNDYDYYCDVFVHSHSLWTAYSGLREIGSFGSEIATPTPLADVFAHGTSFRILDWSYYHRTLYFKFILSTNHAPLHNSDPLITIHLILIPGRHGNCHLLCIFPRSPWQLSKPIRFRDLTERSVGLAEGIFFRRSVRLNEMLSCKAKTMEGDYI